MVWNSKTGYKRQRKYSSRKTTQTQTTKQRTRLPSQTYVWATHIRWINSREKSKRTKKHQTQIRLAKSMPSNRRQRPIRGQYSMAWGQRKNEKPHLPVPGAWGHKHLPPKEPSHRDVKMHNRCICRATKGNIQRSKKCNIWSIPFLQLQTRTQRITGKIPL